MCSTMQKERRFGRSDRYNQVFITIGFERSSSKCVRFGSRWFQCSMLSEYPCNDQHFHYYHCCMHLAGCRGLSRVCVPCNSISVCSALNNKFIIIHRRINHLKPSSMFQISPSYRLVDDSSQLMPTTLNKPVNKSITTGSTVAGLRVVQLMGGPSRLHHDD